MRLPKLVTAAVRRDLAELAAWRSLASMRPSDQVLHLFSGAYADACEAYEKEQGRNVGTITFTVVRRPMQTALSRVLEFYASLAREIAGRAQ
jgi:hypothetical protein